MRLDAHSLKCLALSAMLLILSAAPSVARASERLYPDFSATSPSGQYRFDAKSPDNARQVRRAFQRGFVYTFTDTTTNTILWTRAQPKEGEDSPIAAWIHDSGTLVVRTGWDQLLTFSRSDPVPVGIVSVFEQLPESERSQHSRRTSAGLQWSGSSRWYFMSIEDRLHFVVRAWWGRRVIVECASGRPVQSDPDIQRAVVESERTDILQTLRIASKRPDIVRDPRTDAPDWLYASDVVTAIQIAGKDGLSEAIPMLMELEKWSYVGTASTATLQLDNPLPEGYVDPFSWGEYTVRAKAQSALRRLGVRPAGLPATCFWHANKDFKNREPVCVDQVAHREESCAKVRVGMPPSEVLNTIGAPDAVTSAEGEAWEYDIDSEEPFTLRVRWTTISPPTVSGIERVTPPRWMDGTARDDY